MAENLRYMPFTLDEESFRIGNYFKRRDSLYTYQATFLLIYGLIKGLSILLLPTPESQSLVSRLDLAATMNICLVALIVLVKNTIAAACRDKCPFFLARLKTSFSDAPELHDSGEKDYVMLLNKKYD